MKSSNAKQTSYKDRLTLGLIGEELKSYKFFNGLAAVDLDHTFYRPDLSHLIFTCMNLDDTSDETFDFYYNLMQQYSQKLEPKNCSVEHLATVVFHELKARFGPP